MGGGTNKQAPRGKSPAGYILCNRIVEEFPNSLVRPHQKPRTEGLTCAVRLRKITIIPGGQNKKTKYF